MIAFFAATNHPNGPLRISKLYFNEFKRSWFVICDWWISILFVCFCVSRFVACDCNYDWRQWKMQLWRWLLNLRVCMFVKSAVVNGGCQSSNLCHAMDHSRGALVALGRPHRIDWGNNEQMHVKLTMETNPLTKELRPKGLQLNERFWRGARLLHSRSGVGYMHLVFSRTVSSSTRNNEMITKGKMLLLYIKFSQQILFFNPLSANSDQKHIFS